MQKDNTGLGSNHSYLINAVDNDNSKFVVTGNGNVGIGTTNPQATFDVNGNIKITDGTQGVGKVLMSDDIGRGSWQNISSTGGTMPPGTATGQTLRYDGANWTTASNLLNDGTNVGIGTTPNSMARLDIAISSDMLPLKIERGINNMQVGYNGIQTMSGANAANLLLTCIIHKLLIKAY